MATLTQADISESRKVFDSCDLNGDGFIAGDGYIEFKEFVAWWTN
jgi:Ca2+-binding EF-hand superfamily protein